MSVSGVLKFGIKKLLHSPKVLALSIAFLLLLIGGAVVWGSLAEYQEAFWDKTPTLSEEEVREYREQAQTARNAYFLVIGKPTDLENVGAYNQGAFSGGYNEAACFYDALADYKQDRLYAVTSELELKETEYTKANARTAKLIRYSVAASAMMIFVGMFVGIYVFGNDKSGGRMKNILAGGADRKTVFFGQLLTSAVLTIGIWVLFALVGALVFGLGETSNVYNLYHTRCSVTSAYATYFGKMAFGLLASFLAIASSAFSVIFSRRTGGFFLGTPALLLLGGGIFSMMLRVVSDYIPVAASRAPLVGLPLLPVVPAFSIVMSLLLQALLAAGLFAASYFRFKRSDL